MAEKQVKHKMNKKEIEDWDALYWYVHDNVMEYDEKQGLPSDMVRRLKGLQHGKFMANNNTKEMADYSFEMILLTFKFCMPNILRCFNNNSFDDDMKKFNYAVKIVENNLNNVYRRLKNAKMAEEKINNADVSTAANYVNTFKAKETKQNHALDDLW